jgi:serine/threonine-protein kinase RsbW
MMTGRGNGPGAGGEDRTEPVLSLEIANDLEGLSRAMESADRFLTDQRVEDEAAFTVRLALEEIVTNILKYAYQDSATHQIAIDLRLSPDRVVLRVSDDGREFDPLAAPAPDLDLPIEDKEVGGVGIHLVKAMAERLSYERVGGKNVLSATIRREPKG